jgi:hypothetical protein
MFLTQFEHIMKRISMFLYSSNDVHYILGQDTLLLISEKSLGLAEIQFRDLPYGIFAPPLPQQLIFTNFNIYFCTFIGLLYLKLKDLNKTQLEKKSSCRTLPHRESRINDRHCRTSRLCT